MNRDDDGYLGALGLRVVRVAESAVAGGGRPCDQAATWVVRDLAVTSAVKTTT